MNDLSLQDTFDPLTTSCRVCVSGQAQPFQTVGEQEYWKCPTCQAIFLKASQLPNAETELARYLLHKNDPQDPRYRDFLNKLAQPLTERLEPGQEGLDYGCGPGPVLAQILIEMGHTVRLYDPFFNPDVSALKQTYDFITCTEVAEHFHRPAQEFARLSTLLRPGGWLGIMTCFLTDDLHFADWHYRRDDTHVVFYRQETFHYLAMHFDWQCEIPAKDVVLMRKGCGVAVPLLIGVQ